MPGEIRKHRFRHFGPTFFPSSDETVISSLLHLSCLEGEHESAKSGEIEVAKKMECLSFELTSQNSLAFFSSQRGIFLPEFAPVHTGRALF